DRNVSRAARRLSMHRRTLQRYLGQLRQPHRC
ncbi:helix-turn-helix domain-containing protein, partial [Rhizobium ruizarguesonis]